ncbi:MAG: T9SS type A sorting domain-containing protein [Saprospiraceae bacterium]|nr:T9SS type A sorting domain-containing protein [Saprospiraceae bacterium]
MKKFVFLIILISNFINPSLHGQKDVYLKINHLLNEESFAFGKMTKNNRDQNYKISRIDYYLSNIKLHHDNGTISSIKNYYILVNKNETVNHLLGKYDINQLDSITFNIGIDSITNHADPTQYPSDHPLAPKDPDMHWGWAAGYKFVVIEGNNGPDLLYEYQLHAFGDNLLTHVAIPCKGQIINDQLTVALDANYANAMNDMDLTKTVIYHGANKDVKALMNNFKNQIFTETKTASNIKNISLSSIAIFPNPSHQDEVIITLLEDQTYQSTLVIRDIMGRKVKQLENLTVSNIVTLQDKGTYFVELIQNKKIIGRSSIVRL